MRIPLTIKIHPGNLFDGGKNYGIPGLTTHNLWGNILLTTTLVIAVLGKGFITQARGTP